MKQLIFSTLLLIFTILIVYFILDVKNKYSLGKDSYQLDKNHAEEYEKFMQIVEDIERMGHPEEAEYLLEIFHRGKIWISCSLKQRQGLCVNTLGIIKRIFINKFALDHPVEYLDRIKFFDIPEDYMNVFAEILLAGTLYHELQHYKGILSETVVYNKEIDFYKNIHNSEFYKEADPDLQKVYDWAIESAIKTAKAAYRKECER